MRSRICAERFFREKARPLTMSQPSGEMVDHTEAALQQVQLDLLKVKQFTREVAALNHLLQRSDNEMMLRTSQVGSICSSSSSSTQMSDSELKKRIEDLTASASHITHELPFEPNEGSPLDMLLQAAAYRHRDQANAGRADGMSKLSGGAASIAVSSSTPVLGFGLKSTQLNLDSPPPSKRARTAPRAASGVSSGNNGNPRAVVPGSLAYLQQRLNLKRGENGATRMNQPTIPMRMPGLVLMPSDASARGARQHEVVEEAGTWWSCRRFA